MPKQRKNQAAFSDKQEKQRVAYISGDISLYFNHSAYETVATPSLRFGRAGANATA